MGKILDFLSIVPSFEIRFGGGGGKGQGKVDMHYHYAFSIAEAQVIEKSTIIFEQRLGNIFFKGDGFTSQTTIPNAWKKKFFLERGVGYVKIYPLSITLYKNSLDNILVENSDYQYDPNTGTISFINIPQENDYIAGTWTYDPEYPKETTVNADFSVLPIIKQIGFKPYKLEDEGLSSYKEVFTKAQALMDELYKNIYNANMDLLYYPISIGQSILLKDPETGEQKIYFIESFSEYHDNDNHKISVSMVSFPEDTYFTGENILDNVFNRFELEVPDFNIIFLNADGSGFSISAKYNPFYVFGRVYTAIEELDTFYNKPTYLRARIIDYNLSKIYPNTENLNQKPILSKNGVLRQLYNVYWLDSDFTSDQYNEMFPTENSFFAPKDVEFKLYDAEKPEYNIIVKRKCYFAKRPFKRGEFNREYRYVTPFGNKDHFVFLDDQDNMYVSDLRFNTSKLGDKTKVNPAGDLTCLASDGRNIYGIFGTSDVKFWDFTNSQWVLIKSLDLSEVFASPTVHMEGRPFFPAYIDENGYALIFAGTHYGINYRSTGNVLKVKKDDVQLIRFYVYTSASGGFIGNPTFFNNKVYMGYGGWDINTPHDPDVDLFINNFSYIKDYIPNGSIYYAMDLSCKTLYALVGNKFSFLGGLPGFKNYFTVIKRISDNNWETICTFSSPLSDEYINIRPYFVYNNKLFFTGVTSVLKAGLARDTYFEHLIYGTRGNTCVNCIGYIDLINKTLNLIGEHSDNDHYGLSIVGYQAFVYLNNKYLINGFSINNVLDRHVPFITINAD